MTTRRFGANPGIGIGHMFGEFFRWWWGQLAELVPGRWRSAEAGGGDALIIGPAAALGDRPEAVTVSVRQRGRENPVGRFGLGAAGLAGVPRPAGKPVLLRLGESDVLGKTLALPLAAERQLEQALAFEMDRETPFKPDELFWTYRIARRDRQAKQLLVRLLLLPRAKVERMLAGLEHAGLRPRWAEVAAGPDRGCRVPLGGDTRRHGRARPWLQWSAAAACALLALGAIAGPFIRQSAEFSAIERRMAGDRDGAAEAEKLRREIDRLSGNIDLIESERAKTGRPLAILAAVTQLLPDDSYLTEFVQQQRKLTLSGRSAAASRLIGALAGGNLLRNPAFSAPVTRIEATHSEVFSITAEIAP
jgi:general secretion pathway protein L